MYIPENFVLILAFFAALITIYSFLRGRLRG